MCLKKFDNLLSVVYNIVVDVPRLTGGGFRFKLYDKTNPRQI